MALIWNEASKSGQVPHMPSVDLISVQQRCADCRAEWQWVLAGWQAGLPLLHPSARMGDLGASGGSLMVTLNLRQPLSPMGVGVGYQNCYFRFLWC